MALEMKVQGPKSKVQWNGEVILGSNHKLNKPWQVNKNLKKNGTNIAKTCRGNQVIWNSKWKTFDSS